MTLQEVLKNPVTYLYMFADNEFLELLAPARATIILNKRENAKKIINGQASIAGSDFKTWTSAIYNQIKSIYGLTPQDILERLALGKSVAGLNWSKGVYGIGETTQTTFNQDGTIVNPTTGLVTSTPAPVVNVTAIRDESGSIVGHATTTSDGTQYQSVKGSDGTYKAYSFSNSSVQQYANGSSYDATKAAEIWQNVLTYLPQVTQSIISIIEASGNKAITAETTSPAQSDWEGTSGIDTTGALLIAGGAAALIALSKKK